MLHIRQKIADTREQIETGIKAAYNVALTALCIAVLALILAVSRAV